MSQELLPVETDQDEEEGPVGCLEVVQRMVTYSFYGCLILIALPIVGFFVYAALESDFSDLEVGGSTNTPAATERPRPTNTPRPTERPDPQDEIDEVFDQMEMAFDGNPSQRQIQALLDPVLGSFGLPLTADNYSRAGSTLVSLRQQSQNGITEMMILEWLSAFDPPSGMEFPEAAGLAFSDLETQ